MKLLTRQALLDHYDRSSDFRAFMRAYMRDMAHGAKHIRDKLVWDKHDLAERYAVALDGLRGISFRITIGKNRRAPFTSVPYARFNYIYGTWVAPAFRRQGVNTGMIKALTARTRQPTLVMIADDNLASQASYMRAGFKPEPSWKGYNGTTWYVFTPAGRSPP